MLLVDDDQAQIREFDFLLDEGVGPDDQLGIALGNVAAGLTFAIFFHRSGEQNNAIAGVFENAASGKIMLLGENLGRCHQRDLIAIFDGDDGGFEGDDRLAGSDITLQQASHRRRLFHV